eukprot:6214631-Pleurochrysis_carterae.AAC.6
MPVAAAGVGGCDAGSLLRSSLLALGRSKWIAWEDAAEVPAGVAAAGAAAAAAAGTAAASSPLL